MKRKNHLINVIISVFFLFITLKSALAVPFEYSVIHREGESVCIGWGTPPFYDFSAQNGTFVPYTGASQTVDLNAQNLIMGDNLTMQTNANITTEMPNCTNTGIVGNSTYFDGIAGYVSVAADAHWDFMSGTNDFTIETWVKYDVVKTAAGQYDIYLAHDTGGGNQNKWMFVRTNDFYGGGYGLYFHANGGGSVFLFDYEFVPLASKWYHLAVTRDGSDWVLYVNGTAVDTASSSYSIPLISAPLTMGQGEGIGYFNGSMDEVRMYNRTLTATEISNSYSQGIKRMVSNVTSNNDLMAYWNFDKDANDYSGFGNNGTLEEGSYINTNCTYYNITSGGFSSKSLIFNGNFNMNTNLNITGCIIYNGGILGNCT